MWGRLYLFVADKMIHDSGVLKKAVKDKRTMLKHTTTQWVFDNSVNVTMSKYCG